MEQQHTRRTRAVLRGTVALALTVAAALSAAPTAGAQDGWAVAGPQREFGSATPADEGLEITWLAGGVAPAGASEDLVAAPPAGPEAAGPSDSGSLSAGPEATAHGADDPRATDDLISNNGCRFQAPSDALPHGQSCIDTGRIHADGRVHVHAQVPAVLHVSINDEPAIEGTAEGDDPPVFGSFENYNSDQTSAPVYDFWTKPFELVHGETYYISATATDSGGNRSWAYGQVTIPKRNAYIVFDRIHVLSDADTDKAGITNRGEIKFDFYVNGTKYHHRSENKIASGDWVELDPPGRSVGYSVHLEGAPRFTELMVAGTEDDPGKCVIEAGGPPWWSSSGCDYAQASATIDLDDLFAGEPALPGPQNEFALYTGDHHLEFLVYGRWETEWV